MYGPFRKTFHVRVEEYGGSRIIAGKEEEGEEDIEVI